MADSYCDSQVYGALSYALIWHKIVNNGRGENLLVLALSIAYHLRSDAFYVD
jgi:hypothetical protein